MSVGLVVNSYERTYRDVLTPGFFPAIAESNCRQTDEAVALINNVVDRDDARDRAEELLRAGEITSYAFVSDHIDNAMQCARLPRRALRTRPFLLDYGLVMPHVVSTDWLLGWDAETRLVEPTNWIDPALALLEDDRRIFHASLSWPPALDGDPGLEADAIDWIGDFALSWGFSDQLFLVRRKELLRPIYRTFAPAAIVRHAPHPYTFEYRLESFQRATGRLRATLSTSHFRTNYIEGVLIRTGGETRWDVFRLKALRKIEFTVIDRLPASTGPRFNMHANSSFGRVPG